MRTHFKITDVYENEYFLRVEDGKYDLLLRNGTPHSLDAITGRSAELAYSLHVAENSEDVMSALSLVYSSYKIERWSPVKSHNWAKETKCG